MIHTENNFPKTIPLASSKDKLKCRKVKAVLRYYEPSAHISVEQYAHHLLFKFYPFRNKEHLKSPPFSGTYFKKFQESVVTEIVDGNIEDTTFHSALNISKGYFGKNLPLLK